MMGKRRRLPNCTNTPQIECAATRNLHKRLFSNHFGFLRVSHQQQRSAKCRQLGASRFHYCKSLVSVKLYFQRGPALAFGLSNIAWLRSASSATAFSPSPLTAIVTHVEGSAVEILNKRHLHSLQLPVSAERGWSLHNSSCRSSPRTNQSQRLSSACWGQPNTHLCLLRRSFTDCTASTAPSRLKGASAGAHKTSAKSVFGIGSRPLRVQHSTMAPLAAATFAEPETYADQLHAKVILPL